MSSAAGCLNPPASSAVGCRQRVGDGHAPPLPPPPPPAMRPPTPRRLVAAAASAAAGHPHPHPPTQRAIILHPRHAYRLPRPLPVVRPGGGAADAWPPKPSSLAAALDFDALSCVAARLGDGRSLAAFAATCRACKQVAYDENLWRRECDRRFGPVAPLPLPSQKQQQQQQQQQHQQHQQQQHGALSPPSSSPFSWRRLYAFNAAAYEAVVAAAREAERARAMSRFLGGAAARRWLAGRAAFAH